MIKRLTRPSVLVLMLAAISLLAGCSLAPRDSEQRAPVRADYWPFYTGEYHPGSQTTRQRSLGPLIEGRKDGEGREANLVRPFYRYTYDPVADEIEHLALYPIGKYRESYRPEGGADDNVRKSQVWALPFFFYNYFSPRVTEWEYDYGVLFPFIYGGNSTKDGESLSILPFGGTLKGVLGFDEINYLMAPLYMEFRRGEQYTWHVLFPFFKYGDGPGYSAFAINPFYNHSYREGKFDRYSVMWPFINWGTNDMDTAHPQHYWSVMPFIGHSYSDVTDNWTFLWPFFSYATAESTDALIIDAPWPFFRWAEGDHYEEFRLWPLVSHARVGDDYATNVLWPIFWHFEENDEQYVEHRTWIFPFYWERDREYTPEPDGVIRDEYSMNVWPLMSYRKNFADEWRFSLLNVVPGLGEEIDDIYGELFRILIIEGGHDYTSFELLWGLVDYDTSPDELHIAVNPIFQYHLEKFHEPGVPRLGPHELDRESYNFLYGFFGYETGPEGGFIRLLWLFDIPVE